ncbi:MAG: M23 family metallopeptidase [Oligoflexia bacterium]|nr:M23 family metallopeptidase [Oligoflexia bacterium]
MHIKKYFILMVLLIPLCSCSTSYIRSGKYVLIREGDSLDSLVNEFNVSRNSISNANRNLKWKKGEWAFIPQNIGIVPKLMSSSFMNGETMYSDGSYYDGYFLWPTPSSNMITSLYGEDRGNRPFHEGLDVAAPMGSYVLAVEDGEVTVSSEDYGGYGKFLMISHEKGVSSLYGHLSKQLVQQGDNIKKGQIIALTGNSGRSTGPHLHFEVRKSGKAIDPTPFFTIK